MGQESQKCSTNACLPQAYLSMLPVILLCCSTIPLGLGMQNISIQNDIAEFKNTGAIHSLIHVKESLAECLAQRKGKEGSTHCLRCE
jgi:hypothetical protein